MSRKSEKWLNENAHRAENAKLSIELVEETQPVDVIAEAEARHLAEMLNPETVPEWARPAVHGQYQAPNADVALARLAHEEQEAQDKVDAAKKSRQAIEDAAIAERQRLEAQAKAQVELPAKLKDVARTVTSFKPAPAVPPMDPIERGKAALDIALRRSRGEQVEDLPPYTPASNDFQIDSSPQKDALRARVSPALAAAAQRQQEIAQWEQAVGKVFDDLDDGIDLQRVISERDDGTRHRDLVDSLMVGLPVSHAYLKLVNGLLADVSGAVRTKVRLAALLEREVRELENLIGKTDSRGPKMVQGDHSAAWYSERREIETALQQLATVTPESIEGLWIAARSVTQKLEDIAAIREANKGEVLEPLRWHNINETIAHSDAFKATPDQQFSDEPGGRPTRGPNWSVFSGQENR